MKISHLNCGTLYPFMTPWLLGEGSLRRRPALVTHCLLVETLDGLLLVDTGFGRRDFTAPSWMVRAFRQVTPAPLGLQECAFQQVQVLGYRPEDVRHIAVTHMHLDHVGGLVDFPQAQVHILADEYAAITQPNNMEERYVCRREHWAHGPDWQIHPREAGKDWYGFERSDLIQIGELDLCFVPLTGHTRGHSGVALRTPDGWLLHCGDAYVYYGDVDPAGPHYPAQHWRVLKVMGWLTHAFKVLGQYSGRLRALQRQHGDEVRIFCSHDRVEFDAFQGERTTNHANRH